MGSFQAKCHMLDHENAWRNEWLFIISLCKVDNLICVSCKRKADGLKRMREVFMWSVNFMAICLLNSETFCVVWGWYSRKGQGLPQVSTVTCQFTYCSSILIWPGNVETVYTKSYRTFQCSYFFLEEKGVRKDHHHQSTYNWWFDWCVHRINTEHTFKMPFLQSSVHMH